MHLICCPLDKALLRLDQNGYSCPHGHYYDLAKEGYCYLLPVQFKKSLSPGDTRAMVQARRDFLNAGFYEPIAQGLVDALTKHLNVANANILDSGCGEGYYLNQIQKFNHNWSLLGLDISKEAIKKAAKVYKDIMWLVASNKSLPIAINSCDAVLSVFGFVVSDSFHQVLKKDGLFIEIRPKTKHLFELRQQIYEDVILKCDQPKHYAGFNLIERIDLDYVIQVNQQVLSHLLMMTPHFYRMSKQKQCVNFFSKDYMEITVSVAIDIFIKI